MRPSFFTLLVLPITLVAGSAALGGELYSEAILEDGPVAYYRFEDGAARNLSTAKNPAADGTFSKTVQFTSGQRGFAGRVATFDGKGYVDIPDGAAFHTGELSVEFWFRSTQPFDKKFWPASATLVSKATEGWGSGDWTIVGGGLKGNQNEGRILVGVGSTGDGDIVLASGTGLNDGQFHHVVWTRNAVGLNKLYVDGVISGSKKDKGGKITNERAIQLGGDQFLSGGSFFKGDIGGFAFYKHTLAEERVQAHFAAGSFDPRIPPAASRTVEFARDIKPILQKHCFECHGIEKDKGGLSFATRARAMDGGDGGRIIVTGKSALSPIIARIAALDEDSSMPPEGKGERLSAEQVGLVRAWIDQGAEWPASADEIDPRVAKAADHWSFKALSRPAPPKTNDAAWITSPLDAFVLEKLETAKLRPTAPATKQALLRRVSFDLTGLPPTPEEIKSFAEDTRPEAYAELIDRLLASRAYGERWARHWLDVVRYADSGGYETDILYEQAWRYRDYVIRSLNEDKPYDLFLMEQVAGDELWPDQSEAMQNAVAVWTLGQWPNAFDDFPEKLAYVRRTDQVVTLSESMLGLSVGCANCHQHKYDPISQRDYFGLEAIFAATETWDKNRNRKHWAKGETSSYRILRHPPTPAEVRLLARGELNEARGIVSPALPAFLPGGGRLPDSADENTQRRARLARWLVSKENPLTARVIANRVWQWHFGRAIAATPNDLGMAGSPPSHPQLLDWLASELIENGWSLKKLHRVILLSSTYRQSALRETTATATDPQNILLAGFPRRRLEAEAVWDHLHAAAGTLDRKSFGAPFVPKLSPEEMTGIYEIGNNPQGKWPVTKEQNRRAIYILNRRSFRFPFFEAFDPANNGASCPTRQTTTVPAQALTLLNNHTANEQAKAMAARLIREAGDDPEKQVRYAWLLAYSREVSDAELGLALKFIAESDTALIGFCLGLINTTEFIYTN